LIIVDNDDTNDDDDTAVKIAASSKHALRYDEVSGKIYLQINKLGPGDEGDYTCIARNQFGEAICTVTIQPEALAQGELY